MGSEKSIEDPWEKEKSEEEMPEKERLDRERIEKERLERERIEQERLEKERIEMERLERERLEKERFERLKMESKLYLNNSLFMIPSWSDLLGYPTLGTYANHPVLNIETDAVVFFSGYDYSIETNKGTLHYLFGLGCYFLKFELESGKYITDKRILTGLVLPDFVYDLMATSANITLEEDPDVIIAEKVIKVPISLSNKSDDHLTFIKGALMRNVFIPNKDMFLEMMEIIRREDSYQISNEGSKILSAHWDFFNKILISDKMRANVDSSYFNSTAGLDDIIYGADELLENTISQINLSIIEDNIKTLKTIYANIEFDPMYLSSILEQAALSLSSEIPQISSKQIASGAQKSSKKSIFTSAEDRLFEFISWPIQFQRKAKKVTRPLPKLVEPPTSWEQIDTKSPDISKIGTKEIREMEQEEFELDTLKSETVELKQLPPPPKADINQILLYLKRVIAENYDMRSIGQAFEVARESARQMGVSATTLHQAKVWEMSKYANIYIKKEPGYGLPEKEKGDLARKIDEWIFEIAERERLERERIEKARLEKERLERLERERKERERQEQERKEMERLERIRLEKERLAQEQLEKEKLEKIEREKQEALRLERERVEKEKAEKEAIEKEKEELKRLKKERKQKEKEAKQEAKKRKKLEKQKKKLEKKKKKEQEKLKNF
ncbi:MAG: hypothetical protein ACFFBH_05530 [Promethearchaeota archaeon]